MPGQGPSEAVVEMGSTHRAERRPSIYVYDTATAMGKMWAVVSGRREIKRSRWGTQDKYVDPSTMNIEKQTP